MRSTLTKLDRPVAVLCASVFCLAAFLATASGYRSYASAQTHGERLTHIRNVTTQQQDRLRSIVRLAGTSAVPFVTMAAKAEEQAQSLRQDVQSFLASLTSAKDALIAGNTKEYQALITQANTVKDAINAKTSAYNALVSPLQTGISASLTVANISDTLVATSKAPATTSTTKPKKDQSQDTPKKSSSNDRAAPRTASALPDTAAPQAQDQAPPPEPAPAPAVQPPSQ